MDALRNAAQRMLLDLESERAVRDEPDVHAEPAQIERMSCDVRIDKQVELVSLRWADGRIAVSCSCAQPGCAHAKHMLQLLVNHPSHALAPAIDAHRRSSSRLERVLPEAHIALHERPQALTLCEPLADVVTAVVRAGVSSERAASVLETLSRVEAAAGTPLPLGVRRWLGRMREALDARDLPLVAQALTAAATLADDLRAQTPSAGASERIVSWLGSAAGSGVERVSDRVLLEVAREWVTGTERMQIERRYLFDLHTGESFREERVRREPAGSVGSCPRLIGVGLAEIEQGCAPRRMRLLQYTTTPQIDAASWDMLAAWGQRDSEALAGSYRSAQSQFGALAEPFALTVPHSVRHAPLALRLERGPLLPLTADEEPGVLRRFEAVLQSGTLAWVAGRLVDRAGQLMLKPLSLAVVVDDRIRHERL
jgi:hypothetical protein